jgi:hypothetical protein
MALQELSRLTGKDFEEVTRAEAVKVLEGAITRTDAAQVALINKTKNPEERAKKLAARGLQKKVWAQVASAFGIQLTNVPQYVQAATAPSGDYPEDAHGIAKNQGSSFTLEGTIYRVYWPGVFAALAGAINGRTSFFRTNLRKGVFDKAEDIARKYPGLTVNRSGA